VKDPCHVREKPVKSQRSTRNHSPHLDCDRAEFGGVSSALVQASPVAMVLLDAERKVRAWNLAVERLLGWTAQETIDRPSPIAAESAGCDFQELVQSASCGDTITGRAVRVKKRDGSAVDVRASLGPVRAGGDRITGTLIVLSDDTGNKELETLFRHLQKTEAIGRLACGIAHDFNNMLTVILSRSEDLLKDLPPGDLCDGLNEIRKAGEHAAALTQQLQRFSRKQAPRHRLLDLNLVVASLEKMLRRLVGEKIQIITFLHPALGTVKADPGHLEQVIVNLAVNARDAMPGGGSLTIETSNARVDVRTALRNPGLKPGSYSVVAVHDTGCGMSQEVRSRLFEPFFTTKGTAQGTGLGLTTAHGIITQLGGDIVATSQPGQGTTFRVYLPHAKC
jgi:PAS domain S-box-containing protein